MLTIPTSRTDRQDKVSGCVISDSPPKRHIKGKVSLGYVWKGAE